MQLRVELGRTAEVSSLFSSKLTESYEESHQILDAGHLTPAPLGVILLGSVSPVDMSSINELPRARTTAHALANRYC